MARLLRDLLLQIGKQGECVNWPELVKIGCPEAFEDFAVNWSEKDVLLTIG